MKLRIADLVDDSIVDGPGFRLTVFAQGCPHHCAGCHNPQTHSFDGGTDVDTEKILQIAAENPLLSGITLSGGEPFAQPRAMAELAGGAKRRGLHVMAYTGYVFEDLLGMPEMTPLMEKVDVLVDGPFILEERSLALKFRGSRNQRIIDVPQSLLTGKTVVLDWDSGYGY